ncbi:MAG: glutamate--tRNA ligase [Desulfobacteraceae bacterium]|nr:glutamate--tRNA ligase [Desulfobacteraceae bacterium]
METIVTRFPPSPTGYLHIGGARTALFNWLYARGRGGRFILRFEDTDVQRSTQQYVDAMTDSLQWLGIDWDEGPYFQSRRLDIYREYIQRLIDSGNAYYCTCSKQEVDAMRQAAVKEGGKPGYDGTCREKKLPPRPGAVVRFKSPRAGNTVVEDKIRDNIVFPNAELDDFIIQRGDGMPIYNLAVVVDDITMGVNTIIRGDDHISNTPKQILLYRALEAQVPDFGHVPMVLGHDKARLSKRHGAMSVTAYRDMGYYPDALLNYLVRLGWSHGDQEFFTRQELIEKFDLEHIGRSAGVFNQEKLLALNAEHIRNASGQDLASHLIPFLRNLGIEAEEGEYLYDVIKTLKPRSKTFVEMAEGAEFYFKAPESYEEKGVKKFFKPGLIEPLRRLVKILENTELFEEKQLESAFMQVMEEHNLKFGKIAQPVRLALSGKTVSPGIFEMIEVLGRGETVARLNRAVSFMAQQVSAEA